MIKERIQWPSIQNRLDSCRHMAEAGEEDEAREMLIKLAKDILGKLEKVSK